MQASGHHSRSRMPNTLCCQPVLKFESYSPQHCHNLNPQNSSHNSQDRFCTLESSLLIETYYNSPSSVTFSPNNESSLSHQEDANELKHKLRELENVMFGPDLDFLENYENTLLASAEIDSWRQIVEPTPRGDHLKQVLIACAKAVSNDDVATSQRLMSELRQLVSVSGEPLQRLGAYMLEGLVARVSSSGRFLYKSREPANFKLLSYMHLLHEACPYFKYGYMSANGAIAEAMKDEERVHIIDFQIGQGSQWVPLIQAFAARPGGPPRIRITVIGDAMSVYAPRGGGSNIVGRRLSKLAKSFKVPFEFKSSSGAHLENLVDRTGEEALAVNFAFVLHRTPDEGVNTVLRMVKRLNPKVVTLVEQELNTNTAAFYPRFLETLDYYTAMFESIDVTVSREDKERINMEQHCLARDVVNVIACEGGERVERHETLGKWKSRFKMAGFRQFPLSSLVNGTIKKLMESWCNRFSVEERDGALYLGWLNRDLVAASAWK
ncbi:hypothetical protein ABFX02_13G002700 [Erythranthe guttata]